MLEAAENYAEAKFNLNCSSPAAVAAVNATARRRINCLGAVAVQQLQGLWGKL